MKTVLLLIIAFPFLQVTYADEFTENQNTRALQIEDLVNYDGKITVYSLGPQVKREKRSFRGYAILGSADLTEMVDRVRLLKALGKSIRESNGDPFACFSPRHGLRFLRFLKEGRTSDIVICFECESSKAFGFGFKSFLQTSSAQPVFDKFLVDNGVRLAQKEEAEGGTGKPATRFQSKPEGSDKPQPKSEGRSQ